MLNRSHSTRHKKMLLSRTSSAILTYILDVSQSCTHDSTIAFPDHLIAYMLSFNMMVETQITAGYLMTKPNEAVFANSSVSYHFQY